MTGRERFLTALDNKKPDCLPCAVHNWMDYYLTTYLGGMDALSAYRSVGMDPVLYTAPKLVYGERDLKNWVRQEKRLGREADGVESFEETFTTPEGTLRVVGAFNKFTRWETEPMIKTDADFELFAKYYPVATGADWSAVLQLKDAVGDSGIIRTHNQAYGQPGAFQSLTCLLGTEETIYKCIDEPDWVTYALNVITEKILKQIDGMGKFWGVDLVENGGGAASSTVISPEMHKKFCLPYDKKVNEAIRRQGPKVVYHLCGGLMPLLETVAENGADALETMTPASMGGDCRMEEAARRVGDKLAFIGGFDQNEGFERGNLAFMEKEVARLFEAKPSGGYICSPSDHFFFGEVSNLKRFAALCRACKY